jgi:uncharacterized membrane protein
LPRARQKRSLALALNRGAYWISRHWLSVVNLLVALYVGIPFLAPVLMRFGPEVPARVIYRVYSAACHQMAFRSWFLFGEQSHYPLRAAGLQQVGSFEEYVEDEPAFAEIDATTEFFRLWSPARSFLGNERMGYKVALCQRDVAIYLSLLAAGILFSLMRRHIRPLRWQLFALLGGLPVALDGGYQLLSYLLPGVLPPHETTPLLRTMTGSLFGIGLAWLAYPQIHLGMEEMELEFREKLTRAQVIPED